MPRHPAVYAFGCETGRQHEISRRMLCSLLPVWVHVCPLFLPSLLPAASLLQPDFVNIGNENNKTALMFASQLKNAHELVRFLLSHGADPNASTVRGHTAVVFASGARGTINNNTRKPRPVHLIPSAIVTVSWCYAGTQHCMALA